MLDDAGSIASLAGLAVSLVGLAIAIWQIMKLRGETRAGNEAAAETRRALQRENAGVNLTRVNERIEGLKELHRRGEWDRALDRYRPIIELLTEARYGHPEISDDHAAVLHGVIVILGEIEAAVEDRTTDDPQDSPGQFNLQLSNAQSRLAVIHSQWQQSP